MKATIFDSFSENGHVCHLSSIDLKAYVENIPADYDQYEVQREIVKNIYLDDLISTVLYRRHIPPIVLVLPEESFSVSGSEIDIRYFKILDGLQRTFRLKIIFDTIAFFVDKYEKDHNLLEFSRLKMSREFKSELEGINSSSAILYAITHHFVNVLDSQVERLKALFERDQWFEIWVGLLPGDEVSKMLILNAGHKPVKTKHQLELLYRYVFDVLPKAEFPEFRVVKEKEISSTQYSKTRGVGEFHFSHLITAILSLSEGRPITGNIDLIQKTQADYFDEEVFAQYLTLSFLRAFVDSLLRIDRKLYAAFGEIGSRWMGRETSLVGLYAATGQYLVQSKLTPSDAVAHLAKTIEANAEALDLTSFEQERNSLDLAKINIGNVNKRAVFEAVLQLLSGSEVSLDWKRYFRR